MAAWKSRRREPSASAGKRRQDACETVEALVIRNEPGDREEARRILEEHFEHVRETRA
jgi:DNA-binding GntR family transcriptional regulator